MPAQFGPGAQNTQGAYKLPKVLPRWSSPSSSPWPSGLRWCHPDRQAGVRHNKALGGMYNPRTSKRLPGTHTLTKHCSARNKRALLRQPLPEGVSHRHRPCPRPAPPSHRKALNPFKCCKCWELSLSDRTQVSSASSPPYQGHFFAMQAWRFVATKTRQIRPHTVATRMTPPES